jgi:hypothetical protein
MTPSSVKNTYGILVYSKEYKFRILRKYILAQMNTAPACAQVPCRASNPQSLCTWFCHSMSFAWTSSETAACFWHMIKTRIRHKEDVLVNPMNLTNVQFFVAVLNKLVCGGERRNSLCCLQWRLSSLGPSAPLILAVLWTCSGRSSLCVQAVSPTAFKCRKREREPFNVTS